jgi:hypothetical protein
MDKKYTEAVKEAKQFLFDNGLTPMDLMPAEQLLYLEEGSRRASNRKVHFHTRCLICMALWKQAFLAGKMAIKILRDKLSIPEGTHVLPKRYSDPLYKLKVVSALRKEVRERSKDVGD